MAKRDQVVRRSEMCILWILVHRIDPAIANGETSQVDPWIGFELYFASYVWNIVSCVAFASEVDFSALVLWVLRHEVVQEVVEVLCNGIFRPAQ